MAYKHFKPHAGRYGVKPEFVSAAIVQVQNTTQTVLIPTPKRKCYVERAALILTVVGLDNDGTILTKLQIMGTDGSTARDLTSTAFSLEGRTALVPVELTIDATVGNRYLAEGETLRISTVSGATTDTTAVGVVAVELLVQQ